MRTNQFGECDAEREQQGGCDARMAVGGMQFHRCVFGRWLGALSSTLAQPLAVVSARAVFAHEVLGQQRGLNWF